MINLHTFSPSSDFPLKASQESSIQPSGSLQQARVPSVPVIWRWGLDRAQVQQAEQQGMTAVSIAVISLFLFTTDLQGELGQCLPAP